MPFRVATYQQGLPEDEKAEVRDMLQNMGSRAWALLDERVKVQFEKAMESGTSTPGGFMMELAERQFRKVILRQTMTGGHGSTGKGGGQAFGEVEAGTKQDCIQSGANSACEVLEQFASHILILNNGNDNERPTIRMSEDEEGGIVDAQRDTTLATGGLEIGENYMRRKYKIPKPMPGEATIGGKDSGAGVPPASPLPNNPAIQQSNNPRKAGETPARQKTPAEASLGELPIADCRLPIANALAETLSPLADQMRAGLKLPEADQPAFFDRLGKEINQSATGNLQSVADAVLPAIMRHFLKGLKSPMPSEASFAEADHPRDEGGKFTYGDAVGKAGTWQEMGLPHARDMKADPLEPAADVNEARQRVAKGFVVKDYAGRELKFGHQIFDHWDEKGKPTAEGDRRLRRLNDAVKTAQDPREVYKQTTVDGLQTAYIRASQDDKGHRRYHFGFLADKEGIPHGRPARDMLEMDARSRSISRLMRRVGWPLSSRAPGMPSGPSCSVRRPISRLCRRRCRRI